MASQKSKRRVSSTDVFNREHRVRWALPAMLFLLGLGLIVARLAPLPPIGGVRLSAPWVFDDFRGAVYYPTQAFWHGVNPYHSTRYLALYPVNAPFSGYAPATFLVYLPAGFLSLGAASAGHFVLSLILTIMLAWIALRLSGWRLSAATILATTGLILLSRPGQWNLLLGQVTLPAVLGVYTAVLLATQKPSAAGVGLAFSLLKPTFGVPLLALLLVQKAWRAVLWGLGITAVVNIPILAVLVAREGSLRAFLAPLLRIQREWSTDVANSPLTNIWRIDAPALVSRLQGTPLGTAASWFVSVAVIGVAGLVLWRLSSTRADAATGPISMGIVCCAVLLSIYHKAYDLLLLTLPITLLLPALKQRPHDRGLLLQAALFAILAGNYLSSESTLAALHPGQFTLFILASLNGLALLTVFAVYCRQALAYPAMGQLPSSGIERLASRSTSLRPDHDSPRAQLE